MQNVMSVVVKTVNLVRKQGLNHRQFQHLSLEMNAEYGDLLFYCEVRWLSRGAMLRRVYQLRNELSAFVAQKGVDVPQLSDPDWITDLAFLVDITTHMNALNTRMQGKDQLINKLFEQVCAFEVKLSLWEEQLQQCDYAHFPMLAERQPADAAAYVAFIASDCALKMTVAQLVECRTRNRESPGSNPRCYRFEVWAFSFTSRRLSRLSCINEYLAIDSGGNVSE